MVKYVRKKVQWMWFCAFELGLNSCQGGRSAVVDAATGKDLFSRDWDARTKLHEYGGGAAIVHNDILYFSHFADNRVYKTELGKEPIPITPGWIILSNILYIIPHLFDIKPGIFREQRPSLC